MNIFSYPTSRNKEEVRRLESLIIRNGGKDYRSISSNDKNEMERIAKKYLNQPIFPSRAVKPTKNLAHLTAACGGPKGEWISKLKEMGYTFTLGDNTFYANIPLIWAIANAHFSFAMELGKQAPEAVNYKGRGSSALHIAIAKNYHKGESSFGGKRMKISSLELAKTLHKHGADLNTPITKPEKGEKNKSGIHFGGNTALHLACLCRDFPTIEWLLEQPEIYPAPINDDGKTPFDLLVETDYESAREFLSQYVGAFRLEKSAFCNQENLMRCKAKMKNALSNPDLMANYWQYVLKKVSLSYLYVLGNYTCSKLWETSSAISTSFFTWLCGGGSRNYAEVHY